MVFKLIKPITEKDKSDYERLNIEMRFNANYPNLINYLWRLEHLSQFIRTTSLTIEEGKETAVSGLDIKLIISTLIGEGPGDSDLLKSQAVAFKPLDIQRNPFESKGMPAHLAKKSQQYQLSGIISHGKYPTAIINDEVYKVGDRIENGRILEITPKGVVLMEGQESIMLTIDVNQEILE